MPVSDSLYHGSPESILTQHWLDSAGDALVGKAGAGPARVSPIGLTGLAIVSGALAVTGPIGQPDGLGGGGNLTSVGWAKTIKMAVGAAMYWDVYGFPSTNRFFGFGGTSDGNVYFFRTQFDDGTTPPRYDIILGPTGSAFFRGTVWSEASTGAGFFATNRNLGVDYCGLYKDGATTRLFDASFGDFITFGALANTLYLNEQEVAINKNAVGNRYAYIDFHGDDTYTDFGLRVYRFGVPSGANGTSGLTHRGTGGLYIETQEAGATVHVFQSGASEMKWESGKTVALRGAFNYTGIGISFPASGTVTTNPNSLDCYEEGAWTPTSGTAGVTVAENVYASYVRIGAFVKAQCYLTITNSTGAPITQVQINGLPFAQLALNYGGCYMHYNQGNNGIQYHNYVVVSAASSAHYWQNAQPNGAAWTPMVTYFYETADNF